MYKHVNFKNGGFQNSKTHTESMRRKQDPKVTTIAIKARFFVSDSTAFPPSVLVLAPGKILVSVAALASDRILVSVPTLAAPWGNSAKWEAAELVCRVILSQHPNAIDCLVIRGRCRV